MTSAVHTRTRRRPAWVVGAVAGALVLASVSHLSAATAHQVKPKAAGEHPAFRPHAIVLPDGAILAYSIRPGPGPTLVLVPETHGDRTQFQEPAFLAQLDPSLRLVIVESRGQGRSWPPPSAAQATIEQYATDALAVVSRLDLREWYVGGHSLGGMIALEIAGRRPAGLRGVITLEGWVHARVQREAFPTTAPPTEAERAEARQQRVERYRSQRWSDEEFAALGQIWTAWQRGEPIARELSYPWLSVWGDRGRSTRPSRAQLLLPESPQVRLHWITGADHYVTDPPHAAEVGRVVAAFIRETETAIAARPNVVLILIDDLGYGDLGCYGSPKHRTPHLDRLAAGGVRFTDFHSNGAVCSPTRAALLTGQYPQRHGVEAAIGFTLTDGVPLDRTTIAEALAPAGYRCGVFGKWHVGHVTKFGPNDQGFHESTCTNNNPDYHSHVSRDGNLDWWQDQRLADQPGYLVDLVTRQAVRFIHENRARPFFLYLPQLAVHFPFQGPRDPPHRTPGRKWDGDDRYGPLPKKEFPRAYREMVEAVDASVGQVVAALDELRLRERTLIFVCSDNGAYAWVGSNGPLRGQKGDLHEGGHRVPALANWPGKIVPGRELGVTAMTMDLMPTLLAVAGALPPPAWRGDGVDLSGVLFRGEAMAPRAFFWRDANEKAVRRGDWKLVAGREKTELFNLAQDLGEQRDLAAAQPEIRSQLLAKLAAWERDVGPRKADR